MTDIGMTIMIDDRSPSRFEEVVKIIESAGVHVHERLPHLGTVIGVGDSSQLAKVRSIDGVQHVRPEKTFRLPPMSDVLPQ